MLTCQCFRLNFSHPGFDSHPFSLVGLIAGASHTVLHHVNQTGILKHRPKTTKTSSTVEAAASDDSKPLASEPLIREGIPDADEEASVSAEGSKPLPSEPMTQTKIPDADDTEAVPSNEKTKSDRRKRHLPQACGVSIEGKSLCNSQKNTQGSIGDSLVDSPAKSSISAGERLQLGVDIARRRKRNDNAARSKRRSDQPCDGSIDGKSVCKGIKAIQEAIGEVSVDTPVAPAIVGERLELGEVDAIRAKRSAHDGESKEHHLQPCDASINGQSPCKGKKAFQESIGEVSVDRTHAPSVPASKLQLGEMDAGRRKRHADTKISKRHTLEPCDAEINYLCNGQKMIQETIGEVSIDSPVAPPAPQKRLELGEVGARRRKRHTYAGTPTVILNYDLIVEDTYAEFHNDDISYHEEHNLEQTPGLLGYKTDEQTPKSEQMLADSQHEAST